MRSEPSIASHFPPSFSFQASIFSRTLFEGPLAGIPNRPHTKHKTDQHRPFSLLALSAAIFLTAFVAISVDTSFYHPSSPLTETLLTNPTLAPLNSILYNTQSSNLATHGLHPHYQHLVASIPLLLGPAVILLPLSLSLKILPRLPLLSAFSGILFLSCIPHQEPRFLLPAVPLILTSLHVPRSKSLSQYWLASWILFNAALGSLMGTYHQGGVVPAQIWLGGARTHGIAEVLWWRTYSPPIWLLDHNGIETTDLMGIPFQSLQVRINARLGPGECNKSIGLVAPHSSIDLGIWTQSSAKEGALLFEEIWKYEKHLNLDDLNVGEEGLWETMKRVVGRRGLVIWRIHKPCQADVEDG